jgi:hypothetical protein
LLCNAGLLDDRMPTVPDVPTFDRVGRPPLWVRPASADVGTAIAEEKSGHLRRRVVAGYIP